MKLTKRIATFLLALTLALALVVTTSAEEPAGGTLQITGAADSTTEYTVYKMFDVLNGNSTNENLYKVTPAWENFVTGAASAYFSLDTTGEYVNFNKATTTTADAAIIAELAKAYAVDPNNGITSNVVVKVGGAAVRIDTNGYYLLVPNNNTVSGVMVIKNNGTYSIQEKAVTPGVPQLKKQVYEDSIQGYADQNTVGVGEEILYKVTITAGEGATKYVLHDVMDEHIKLVEGSFHITRGGNVVDPSEYTYVPADQTGDSCSFHIAFEEDWCQSLNKGAVIVVTYKAMLMGEKDPVTGDYSEVDTGVNHPNTAWLRYTDVETVKTALSTVYTQTYEVNILKQDGAGAALKGAGFKLKDNENNYYAYDPQTGKVSWGTKDAATEVFSDVDGKVRFYGVDAEIFYVEETTVPGGYTGAGLTQVSTKTGNVASGSVIIKNTLGNAMPETGGMGTTALYIGGAALVLCALAALVIIKRKNTAA